MKDKIRHFSSNRPLFYGSVGFLTLFLVSIILFGLFSDNYVSRVLFFPDYRAVTDLEEPEISGEARKLPRRNTLEGDLELLVKEMVLGPLQLGHERLFPVNTQVRSVIYRNGVLYIDFSIDILFSKSRTPLPLDTILDFTRKNIVFNFPGVRNIMITVEGELPRTVGNY